jgi:hypothetical protein
MGRICRCGSCTPSDAWRVGSTTWLISGKRDESQWTSSRRSVVCAKEFSRFLLNEEGVAEAERIRAVLRLNERIYRKCLKDRAFRQVVFDHDVDPFDAVLVDDRLPERFREKRYPQMVKQITERRRRSRAQRERAKRRMTPK